MIEPTTEVGVYIWKFSLNIGMIRIKEQQEND
jgi:hypothetical protein